MKRNIFLLAILLISVLFYSCSEDEPTNQAPTFTITSPDNGEEIQQGQTVTISVDADDNVTEVRFFVDGTGVGSSSSFPYNYDWTTTEETLGSHTLKATAKDNGGSSTSAEIAIFLTEGGGSGNEPIAAFVASQTSISPSSSVQFTDQSSNSPTSWSWEFGDGGTSTSQNPSHSYSSTGYYTVLLTATNSYGSDTETKTNYITVSTSGGETGTVTDYDGNTYNTIKIGNQWWMAENLETKHYANGTKIQLVERPNEWSALGYDNRAMCYYNNSTSINADAYVALYTWAAAKDACPNGWHLPTDDEWKQLEMHLGMSQVDADNAGYRGTNEGSKLAGNTGLWADGNLENDAAFGTSGFLALPGGYRYDNGNFLHLGYDATFWSATERDSSYAWYRGLYYSGSGVRRGSYTKSYGSSVRCIKD